MKHVTSQDDILKYITDIGSSLRFHMDVDELLKRVARAACEALGFRHSALYLADDAGFFRVRATYGTSSEQDEYLNQHPLPDSIVVRLTNETYRVSNSYFVPTEAPIWQDEALKASFVIVDDEEQILAVRASFAERGLELPDLHRLWRATDLLLVPLRSGENALLGFLTPDGPLNGLRPTIEKMALLEVFANQAAIMIEGARLYEEAQRNSEQRAALIEIGRALVAPEALRDIHTVYHTIYEQVKRVMPVDCFHVTRYYEVEDRMTIDYLIDEGVLYPPETYRTISPWRRKLLHREKNGYLFSFAQEYRDFAGITNINEGLLGNMRPSESLLFVPIHYGEKAVGVLSVQSYQQQAYTQHDLDILREIGVQAGLAITNARLYSEQREALRQARESEQMKNHFLMTASHELRTPLTAIQGYLELLSVHGDFLDDEKKKRFITNAHHACDELILLLGNMMDASSLDENWVTLKAGSVRVLDALKLILEILEPVIAREDRTVEVSVSEHLYCWVDDLRLRQILLNIVGNALKYTPAHTKIEIGALSIPRIDLAGCGAGQSPPLADTEHFVLIAIRDFGPGVAPEDQERLFRKFMRLPGSKASKQRGAGWGLYLCRQLVEAMGGQIWVQSKGIPGEATTFFIALPQAEGQERS